MVRLEGHAFSPEDIALSRDMYLLQVRLEGHSFIYLFIFAVEKKISDFIWF